MLRDESLQKHTLNLFAGDYERVQDLFPNLSAAVVIRHIIRAHIEQVEAAGSSELNARVDINL